MIWTRDSEDALSNAKSDKKVIISYSCSMEFNRLSLSNSCRVLMNSMTVFFRSWRKEIRVS